MGSDKIKEAVMEWNHKIVIVKQEKGGEVCHCKIKFCLYRSFTAIIYRRVFNFHIFAQPLLTVIPIICLF